MSYTLLSVSEPTARKQHKCIWCGQPIEVGEKHRHERSIYDGQFQDQRWHPECDDAFAEELRYEGGHELEFEPYGNQRPTRSAVGVGIGARQRGNRPHEPAILRPFQLGVK